MSEHSGCDELVRGFIQYVKYGVPEMTQEISLTSNHTVLNPDLPGVYLVSIAVTNNEGLTSHSQAQAITIPGEWLNEWAREWASKRMIEVSGGWVSDGGGRFVGRWVSMSERGSEWVVKCLSERLTECMSERLTECMSERLTGCLSERLTECISERLTDRMCEWLN